MLRRFLLLRSVFNLLFGVVLLLWLWREGLTGMTRGGFYAVVDGLLTLGLAAALLHRRARLALLTGADGALRLGAGAFVLANPGIEQMPVTMTLMLVVLTIAFVTLGVAGLAYVFLALRGQASEAGRPPLAWPAAAISLCTLLLGVGFTLSFLDQQLLLAIYAIALGVILGFAAMRAGLMTAQATG
ncbi:MAG TPA: hypothetical protein VLE45_06670 [Burkholderiaceae bacterium]|nr:hypothetical protein [Burkholderiaceae bacterium]